MHVNPTPPYPAAQVSSTARREIAATMHRSPAAPAHDVVADFDFERMTVRDYDAAISNLIWEGKVTADDLLKISATIVPPLRPAGMSFEAFLDQPMGVSYACIRDQIEGASKDGRLSDRDTYRFVLDLMQNLDRRVAKVDVHA